MPTKKDSGGQESEFEAEGPSEVVVVLAPRSLKSVLKQSGQRLSSNAFDCLNTFVIGFLECIARQANGLMREEIALRVSVSKSGSQRLSVPWSTVMSCVGTLTPDAESWFSTWHTTLVQHANDNYHALLAEKAPLMDVEECERIFRMALHPIMNISPLILASITGAMNDTVRWTVRVAVRLAETKGLGTIRKGEMQSVLTRAPIFETLHKYMQPAGPVPLDFGEMAVNDAGTGTGTGAGAGESEDKTRSVDLLPAITLHTPLLKTPILQDDPAARLPTPANSPEKRPSPVGPVDRDLEGPRGSPECRPPSHEDWKDPDEARAEHGQTVAAMPLMVTRIIACSDPSLAWVKMQTTRSHGHVETVMVESRGVCTDEEPAKLLPTPAPTPPTPLTPLTPLTPATTSTATPEEALERMQREVDSLKTLIQQLLTTQIKSC